MENNENKPVGKSGMGWLWWILAIAFVGIIILCICRSCNGSECIKDGCDKAAVENTAKTIETGVARTADSLVIDTVNAQK